MAKTTAYALMIRHSENDWVDEKQPPPGFVWQAPPPPPPYRTCFPHSSIDSDASKTN
jgi:hypothetical protein